MVTPTGLPSFVLLATTYRDYFSRAKTDTFSGRYATVLAPYSINPTATAATPADVARLIYSAAQEGVPTAFLHWRKRMMGRGAQIALLHLVSSYVPRMGMPASPWENLYFALKGDISCGACACANWQTASLNQIRATVHVCVDLAIDAELAADPDIDLLGPFTSTDVDVEPLRVRKTIYLPAPFFGIFLEQDLTPT